MTTTTNKPNVLFWIIGVLALLWNAAGLYQLYLYYYPENMPPGYTEEQIQLLMDLPSWYGIAFIAAVVGGVIACLLLLMRKKLAVTFFMISLIGVVIQMVYYLFFTNANEVMGDNAAFMPVMVIIVAFLLFFYSKYCFKKGWLN